MEYKTVTETKMLYLSTQSSSCTLLNGDFKSKAQYQLGTQMNFRNDPTIMHVEVSMPYVVLTNSNYIINSTNNVLAIGVGGVTSSYVFEQGNYGVSQFVAAFTALVPNTFGITFDNVNSKFSVSNSASAFTLLGSSTIDFVMGFSTDLASTSTAPYTVTMPRVCNFLPIPRFLIHCDVLNNGVVTSSSNGFQQSSDVLATIPNSSRQTTQIAFVNTQSGFQLRNYDLTSLVISIMDDNGALIDFNGISSYFSLKFVITRVVQKIPTTFHQAIALASQTFPDDSV